MGEARRVMQMGAGARGPMPGQPQQIQVDITKTTINPCECGHDLFVPAIRRRKISALLSPTGTELPVNEAVMVCMKCGALGK